MNTRMRIAASLIIGLIVLGCGIEDEDTERYSIASGTLTGTIDGAPWTYAMGTVTESLSSSDGLFVTLYGTGMHDCAARRPDGDHVLVKVPTMPGSYDWGPTQNLTFAYGANKNDVVLSGGGIQVEEVNETTVRASLYAAGHGHEISGAFEFGLDVARVHWRLASRGSSLSGSTCFH